MEYLDFYFPKDEFNDGLKRVAAKRGLELVADGNTVHDPGICPEGKREKTHQNWELRKNGTPLYRVEHDSEDTHLKYETGRDYYSTRLLNLSGKVLLESEHCHINTPDYFSDDDDFPTAFKSVTYLHIEDELALELFREMKAYDEMRKQRYKPAASAA